MKASLKSSTRFVFFSSCFAHLLVFTLVVIVAILLFSSFALKLYLLVYSHTHAHTYTYTHTVTQAHIERCLPHCLWWNVLIFLYFYRFLLFYYCLLQHTIFKMYTIVIYVCMSAHMYVYICMRVSCHVHM